MALVTTRWDSAEHLKTEEGIQLYLEACLEEADDDPALMIHAFGVIARTRNLSQLAQDTGLSSEGLYDARSPGGNPTFDIVAKVAKALGFKLSIQAMG
jgi:probable addiction module antidote protein